MLNAQYTKIMQFSFITFFVVLLIALINVHGKKIKPYICTLPHSADGYNQPITWRCNGQLPLWSYDRKRNECVIFRYGGCGGNDNSFYTREDCESTCHS